jgi:hypothetical protein
MPNSLLKITATFDNGGGSSPYEAATSFREKQENAGELTPNYTPISGGVLIN